jgi:hypothetical protein
MGIINLFFLSRKKENFLLLEKSFGWRSHGENRRANGKGKRKMQKENAKGKCKRPALPAAGAKRSGPARKGFFTVTEPGDSGVDVLQAYARFTAVTPVCCGIPRLLPQSAG